MGIDCRMEDEDGRVLGELPDARSLVPTLLATQDGAMETTVCLRFIDEYGDTRFNQAQMPVLLQELREAVLRCANPQARAHGEALASFVAAATGRMHTYVSFIGD